MRPDPLFRLFLPRAGPFGAGARAAVFHQQDRADLRNFTKPSGESRACAGAQRLCQNRPRANRRRHAGAPHRRNPCRGMAAMLKVFDSRTIADLTQKETGAAQPDRQQNAAAPPGVTVRNGAWTGAELVQTGTFPALGRAWTQPAVAALACNRVEFGNFRLLAVRSSFP